MRQRFLFRKESRMCFLSEGRVRREDKMTIITEENSASEIPFHFPQQWLKLKLRYSNGY